MRTNYLAYAAMSARIGLEPVIEARSSLVSTLFPYLDTKSHVERTDKYNKYFDELDRIEQAEAEAAKAKTDTTPLAK